MCSARVEDFNGWFEVKRQPISRAGVFDYLGSNLTDAPDPNAVYRVLRSPVELARPEFLESCKLLPWVDEHSGLLGPEELDALPADEKGIGGVIGEQIEFDESDHTLYANIKCFSEAQRDLIEAGKEELSLGYRCRYLWQSGTWNGEHYDVIQCHIRGNHLATVTEGRMGPLVAVLDHNDTKGKQTMNEEELREMFRVIMERLDKIEGKTDEEKDEVVAALDSDETAKNGEGMDDAEADAEGAKDKAEEAGELIDETAELAARAAEGAGELKDEEKGSEGTGMDEASITRRVFEHAGRRDKLAAALKPYVGAFDHSGKTEAQVAAYGLKKLGLTAVAGQEIATLNGYMAGAAKHKATARPQGQGMDSRDTSPNKKSWAVAAIEKGGK